MDIQEEIYDKRDFVVMIGPAIALLVFFGILPLTGDISGVEYSWIYSGLAAFSAGVYWFYCRGTYKPRQQQRPVYNHPPPVYREQPVIQTPIIQAPIQPIEPKKYELPVPVFPDSEEPHL